MLGHTKAAAILRVLGWLQIVVAALALLVVLAVMLQPGIHPEQRGLILVVCGVGLALTAAGGVLYLWVGKAVKEHKGWARTAGIALGVLTLPGFPIGTVVGGFILYYLIAQWDTPAAAPAA